MKTKEGLTIKNLKQFPSLEWGDEGGASCDVYLNNKKFFHYYDEGNGGEGVVSDCNISFPELFNFLFEVNRRLDPALLKVYGETSFKRAAVDLFISIMIDRKNDEKIYRRSKNKGYDITVVGIYKVAQKRYASCADESLIDQVKEDIAKKFRCTSSDPDMNFTVYRSIEDFNNL